MSLTACKFLDKQDLDRLKGRDIIESLLRNQFLLVLAKTEMNVEDVQNWVNKNCNGLVYLENRGKDYIIQFENIDDATLFKLSLI